MSGRANYGRIRHSQARIERSGEPLPEFIRHPSVPRSLGSLPFGALS